MSAKDLRGRHAYFSGYVKTEGADTGATLWLFISDKNGKELPNTDVKSNPIRGSTDWKKYEISAQIPKESALLHLGFSLDGKGKAWVDDVELQAGEDGKSSAKRRSVAKLDFEKTVAEAEPPSPKDPNKRVGKTAAKKPMNLDFEAE